MILEAEADDNGQCSEPSLPMQRNRIKELLADRGCGANAIRREIAKAGAEAFIFHLK